MTNIFSELKNMDHQLASALSTMLKLRLVVFLNFDKHAVENAQKTIKNNFDFIRNNKAIRNVRDDFGTPKGHALSL